jgi:hypothetical protein
MQDLTGRRFHMLTVVRFHSGSRRPKWVCLCDCGVEKLVLSYNLTKHSPTMSCGCHRRQANARRSFKHGEGTTAAETSTTTTEYGTWAGMRDRCNNPKNQAFCNYGGRGITVCERWDDYANFLADMGRRPSPSYSIDRINNDAGYSPENCRWATRSEQIRNSRQARYIEAFGENRCLVEWANLYAVNPATISSRIRLGWDAERAISAPVTRP